MYSHFINQEFAMTTNNTSTNNKSAQQNRGTSDNAAGDTQSAAKGKAKQQQAGSKQTSNQNRQNANTTQEDTMSAKTKTNHQFENFANEAANAQQQGVQAFQQFQASFMRGVEDMMKTYTSILQDSGEKNAQAVKTLLSCKTLDEFTQAQNKLWQENFDQLMSNATKLSETSIRVANQCMEPVNEQFTTAVQRAGESFAA